MALKMFAHYFLGCAARLARVPRRFARVFLEIFGANRAILRRVQRQIGAPRTRNDCEKFHGRLKVNADRLRRSARCL